MRRLITIAVLLLVCASYADTARTAGGPEQAASRTPRAGTFAYLRVDQIRSRHILNGTVGAGDLALSEVAITVNAASAAATSAADPVNVGGKVLGYQPAGNQDQHVDSVVLNANGSVTLTLAANATAANTFKVLVSRGVPRQ